MVERTETFSFIVPAAIRSFGDDNWKKTDTAYMEAWNAADSLFRERHITVEGVSYVVTIDWTPLLRRPTAGQLPTNPTERARFALIHLTKLDGDMLSIVWLFYALESLLQTRVGENFGSIVRRLTVLLGLAKDDVAMMKKQLRVLYA